MNGEKRWTTSLLWEMLRWRNLPTVRPFDAEPRQQLYIHSNTEPLEIDRPELLDARYGRQN